jgi:hypothetical protein
MELLLDRKHKLPGYSIGLLYIDGELFCNTLENTDRGLKQDMTLTEIAKLKKSGITAIPTGRYKILMNIISPKYKTKSAYQFCEGKLPRLFNVPGYSGILIHIGNYTKDTEGCILVGKNNVVGSVSNSTEYFLKLYSILKAAFNKNEEIIITIK